MLEKVKMWESPERIMLVLGKACIVENRLCCAIWILNRKVVGSMVMHKKYHHNYERVVINLRKRNSNFVSGKYA
mgnify:CR=1 FL=1